MTRRRVVPEEKWLVGLRLLLHPVERLGRDLLVDRFHALLGQWTGVLDRLPSLAISDAVEYASRSEHLPELRILGIVGQLWLLFRIQVIEVAEELVEAVHRRQ